MRQRTTHRATGPAVALVTADGAAEFDVKIDPGRSATFTAPTRPGSHPYHCTFHRNMHGTLKVG